MVALQFLGGSRLISLNNTLQGCLENALTRAEAQLNVIMTGSEFLTVFAVASTAQLIITVPTRLASRMGPMFGLRRALCRSTSISAGVDNLVWAEGSRPRRRMAAGKDRADHRTPRANTAAHTEAS